MTIVRWEPLRELSTLQSEMNRLFNTVFDAPHANGNGNGNGNGGRRWIPSMDLVETQDDYVLRADLPGVRQDDVKIEMEDNVLTISGERRAEHTDTGGGFVRMERAFGSFARSLTLPRGVDAGAIRASYADGVLELHIPKPEQVKPHRIEISVGDRPTTLEASNN
jgi:HSP20 family protein